MGNPIKYSTTVTSGSYNKGNNAIGVNPIGYGPTATTGWYNSPTPSGGNFIITEVVDGNTPPRFYAPTTDNDWLRLARQEGATGANTGSTAAVKSWFASQANYVVANIDFPTSLPSIVGNGLILNLDAKINASYPGSGTTWTDISGLGNNTILVNSPSFNSGEEAIIFDGADDYGYIPNTANIDWGNQISFGILFYNRGGDYRGLINQGYYSTTGWEWRLGREESGKALYGFIQNTSNSQIYSVITSSLNRWNFAYLTYDGSSVKGYLNGVLQTTASQTGNIKISSLNICIGMRGLDAPGEYFNDGIQIAQIYNRALTQAEVLQNYYQAPIVTDGLVFAIDAGNLVSYESGSTNSYSLTGSLSGSLINGTGYTSSFGGGWIFDGVDDRIQIDTNLSISSSFTINYTVLIKELPTTNEYNYIFLNGAGFRSNGVYAEFGDGPFFSICTVNSSSAAGAVYLSNPQANVVYYATATYENRTLKGYINGNLVDTNNLNFDPVNGSNNTLNIGAHGPFVIPLWGYYNRALTAAEVQQNFNAQRSRFGL